MDYAKPEELTQHRQALEKDVAQTVRRNVPTGSRYKHFRQANYHRCFLKNQPFKINIKALAKTVRRKVPTDSRYKHFRQANYHRCFLKNQPFKINIKALPSAPLPPIVPSLPPTLREKGEQLIQHIRSIPNLKQRGEIQHKGAQAHGSRIFDLVHDVVRNWRAQTPASGWELLAAALRDSNVPRELICNPARW